LAKNIEAFREQVSHMTLMQLWEQNTYLQENLRELSFEQKAGDVLKDKIDSKTYSQRVFDKQACLHDIGDLPNGGHPSIFHCP